MPIRYYYKDERDLVKNLSQYALSTKCACSACRMLREYQTQILEERIKELERERRETEMLLLSKK